MIKKKLTKQEQISMLNQIIEMLDDVNKTLDDLFEKHMKAKALEDSKKV